MEITLNNLACGYGKKTVLRNFSTRIFSGEIFCLLGPNGIGKTTLFKTILGFLPCLEGSVAIDGRDTASFRAREFARRIGYVPQGQSLSFAFRVLDVILMGRIVHLGAFSSPGPADYETAERLMAELGIAHLRDRPYTEISGGERQMVLIARALAQEPAFLMMDEPTSSLDFGNQALILARIRLLAERGLGVILTTHHPEQALMLNSCAALLKKDGESIMGTAREILTENNLQEAYGVPVAVVDAPWHDTRFSFCQPLLI